MVDPFNVTKYDRTPDELLEFAIFAVCVAGKKSEIVAQKVDAFWKTGIVNVIKQSPSCNITSDLYKLRRISSRISS